MADLYPLLLLPEFRERVWGSRDISVLYPHKSARGVEARSEEPIGEVWLTGDDCRVANGGLAGQTLGAVAKNYTKELLGEEYSGTHFPLLLKFLFPKEKLSVQVHPDDEGAKRMGQSCGKTECWYVVAAEPGAKVGLGLKRGVTREQIERGIEDKTLESLMNWIDVRPGEMVYVDAGTVHAIGPGSILLETQQNSDTTYRLYDYGRPRELHIQEGLAATKLATHAGKVRRVGSDGEVNLVSSPCFHVDKFVVREVRDFPARSKAGIQILVALDGCGVMEADGFAPVTFAKGETVVVPAKVREYRIRPQWALEFVRASLPTEAVNEPTTQLVEATAV